MCTFIGTSTRCVFAFLFDLVYYVLLLTSSWYFSKGFLWFACFGVFACWGEHTTVLYIGPLVFFPRVFFFFLAVGETPHS